MNKKQRTIKKEVSYKGRGLHTGNETTITFKPAPENYGRRFIRVDVKNAPEIPAIVEHVVQDQKIDSLRGTTLRLDNVEVHTVEHVLAVLKSGFNYIIVDTLSSLDDMTLAALIRSDQIILVVVPEVASIQAATVTLQAFRSLGISEEAIVPTVNHTYAKGGLSLGTIQSALKRPIKAVIPYEPEVLIQAINSGAPLVLSHPSSAMATAIQKLASVLSPS